MQVNMRLSQIVHLLLLLLLLLLLHHLLFEKAKFINHSTYESEILHVNRFFSELVHRHVTYSLALLLLLI